jgi:hypothetical protein
MESEARKPSRLAPLDLALAKLKDTFHGWRIWYVPHATDGSATWCAQRLPLLHADSPEHLAEYMLEVDERYSSGPYVDEDASPAGAWPWRGTVPPTGL